MSYYSGHDLARSFRTVRKNTIQIAKDIPEDQYGFRATKDTRSVAEMLAHIAAASGWQQRVHGPDLQTFRTFEDFDAYETAAGRFAETLTTKRAIIEALETEGETFAEFLGSLSQTKLAESISFPAPVDPPSKSRLEILMAVKEHEMHHRAQLMLIERMLGIIPHLTRRRQN